MAQAQASDSEETVRLTPRTLLWNKSIDNGSMNRETPRDTPSPPRIEEGDRLLFNNPEETSLLLQDRAHLTVGRKLAFAAGAIPYAMCNTVVGFYLSIFLLEVVILDPTYVLIIVFVGRLFDAVTDPTVGYLCSRTKTRFGRLRPWMLSAAIPAGVVYALLWFVPPGIDNIHYSNVVKFAYYLVFYLALQALLTCIHVPYTSLTMHLSHNSKDRDSATLYRMCFEVMGTILGILVYTAYYIIFVGDRNEQKCDDGEREPDQSERRAYTSHSITLGIILIICIIITFLGVREQQDEIEKDKSVGILQGLKETLGFKPYTMLFFTYLFSWLAVQFVQGNFALYIKYTVGLEKQYPYVIAVLLITAILWMPMWQLVIVKFGKRTAFIAGMWVFMPTLLGLLFVDFCPYVIYGLAVLGGLGVSAAYLLPWSMIPDVIDDASIKMNFRREELFYAFFVFGSKFAVGITLGLSTGTYEIAGYDEDECDQPWTVPLTLKLLVTVPPILFILLSLLFFHYYPITERTREQTKLVLQERRRSRVYEATGGQYLRRPSIVIPDRWTNVSQTGQQTNL